MVDALGELEMLVTLCESTIYHSNKICLEDGGIMPLRNIRY